MRYHKCLTLASELLSDTNDKPAGLLDGGIAVCEYVSRQYGTELTIEEGGLVRRFIDCLEAL